MLGIALLGLLANVVVYRILHDNADGNINVAAARLHVLGDLLGSIGAIVAAVVIITTGWTPIDPLLSVFVALLIVRSAWSVLRKSTLILMENAPETVNPDDLKQTLIAAVPGVRDVHDVHCWSLTTGQTMLTLHLVLEIDADPAMVLREAKQVLVQRFEVAHSALQLEREECPDAV
jgi:cobalt-zinc-cadmium efflux system protein